MIWLLLAACGSKTPCARVPDREPSTSSADLEVVLTDVRTELFPELTGVTVDLVELDSDTDFFQSNLDITTMESPPLQRDYRVLFNPLQFDDPPPHLAVAAILAHELKHVLDYTEMDAAALAEFALWYIDADISEYEHETDEHALQLGCGPGLIAYREWLYDNVDPATVEQKRYDYYTPTEIEQWMEDNE